MRQRLKHTFTKIKATLRSIHRGADQLQQLNELTNPLKWDSPEWLNLHLEIATYAVDKHCFNQSKGFAYRKGSSLGRCQAGPRVSSFGRRSAEAPAGAER